MGVEAIDHINICTADVPGRAASFTEVLGMTVTASRGPGDPARSLWVRDDRQHPLFHLASTDLIRAFRGEPAAGAGSGRIHHVALQCSDYAGTRARLDGRGAKYRASGAQGHRVLFVEEVNGILLELNFLDP